MSQDPDETSAVQNLLLLRTHSRSGPRILSPLVRNQPLGVDNGEVFGNMIRETLADVWHENVATPGRH